MILLSILAILASIIMTLMLAGCIITHAKTIPALVMLAGSIVLFGIFFG